jgi:hypothetical protein
MMFSEENHSHSYNERIVYTGVDGVTGDPRMGIWKTGITSPFS